MLMLYRTKSALGLGWLWISLEEILKNQQTENIGVMIQTELPGNFRLNMNIMLEMGDHHLLALSFDIRKFAHCQLFFSFWNSVPTWL